MESIGSLVRGVFEAAGIVALFVAGGLAYAAALGGGALPAARPALYHPPVEPERPEIPPRVWLVDGYNVLNVAMLGGRAREGWWTGPFRDELLGRADAFEEEAAEIWVVFDGAMPPDAERVGRARPVFAPSADAWLLARIRERDPAQVALVTADRELAASARHRGVEVVAPAAFLARCRVS
ncbi:MAG TPA: NYN domain-containing protein [Myxococcota bacterium]|nr:NYN domain-containing protein [Myxococcota bacterium]